MRIGYDKLEEALVAFGLKVDGNNPILTDGNRVRFDGLPLSAKKGIDRLQRDGDRGLAFLSLNGGAPSDTWTGKIIGGDVALST